MMSHLVDQDMGDERLEAFVRLDPLVEQRAAIEVDHVGQGRDVADRFGADRAPGVEPEQVERIMPYFNK